MRRLAFVRLYLAMLILHLFFSIGTGVYAINRNFKDAPKYIATCESGSTDKAVVGACHQGATILKSVMIGSFIIAWLLETCTFRFSIFFDHCSLWL